MSYFNLEDIVIFDDFYNDMKSLGFDVKEKTYGTTDISYNGNITIYIKYKENEHLLFMTALMHEFTHVHDWHVFIKTFGENHLPQLLKDIKTYYYKLRSEYNAFYTSNVAISLLLDEQCDIDYSPSISILANDLIKHPEDFCIDYYKLFQLFGYLAALEYLDICQDIETYIYNNILPTYQSLTSQIYNLYLYCKNNMYDLSIEEYMNNLSKMLINLTSDSLLLQYKAPSV